MRIPDFQAISLVRKISLLLLFIISCALSETYSQIKPSKTPVGTAVTLPEPPPLPCVPDCRNEERIDIKKIVVKRDTLLIKKGELILTFDEDSLSCKKLIDLSKTQEYQTPFFDILERNGIILSDTSATHISISNLCSNNEKIIIDQLKKYYVKSFMDKIQPIGEPERELPRVSGIKKCLCDKEIYLYEGLNIESEGFVRATQEDEDFESNGGTVSRNLVIEAEKNVFQFVNKTLNDSIREAFNTIQDYPPSSTTIVAILDSGLDINFFSNNLYFETQSVTCLENDFVGWNFIDDNNITEDFFGHGTLVTASFKYALESSTNSNPFKILPVKVLDDCGYGTLYSVTCGLYYAQAKDADIVNASWGLYKHREQLEKAIMELAVDSNIKIVTSTGNNAKDLRDVYHFPSGYSSVYSKYNTQQDYPFKTHDNVYAVGGLNQEYNMQQRCTMDKWSQSNFFKSTIVENAMGYSTLMNSQPYANIDTAPLNCTCEGTSYAAPRFTAALVKQPTLDIYSLPFEVKTSNLYKLYSYWTNKVCSDFEKN